MRKLARVLFGGVFLAFWMASAAQAQAPAACQTYDERNTPSTLFSPGDELIVTGQGFPAATEVKVDFLQATLVPQLTSMRTDDSGAFATAALSLPAEAYAGTATVRAAAGNVSASCEVELVPRFVEAKPVDEDIVVVWGSALGIGALLLAVVVWRRRRASGRTAREERKLPISVLSIPPAPSGFAYLEDDDRDEDDVEVEVRLSDDEPELARVGPAPDDVSSTVARLMQATKGWNER